MTSAGSSPLTPARQVDRIPLVSVPPNVVGALKQNCNMSSTLAVLRGNFMFEKAEIDTELHARLKAAGLTRC